MALFQNSIHDREKAMFDPNHRVKTLSRPEVIQYIEDGQAFLCSDAGTITSLATNTHAINTGALAVTIALNLVVSADNGPLLIEMMEGATLTAVGTILSSTNLNRNSLNPEETVVSVGPTTSSTGTRIWVRLVPGGKDGSAGGGSMAMILKPNTAYLFRITNNGNQTANYSWELMFTEQ